MRHLLLSLFLASPGSPAATAEPIRSAAPPGFWSTWGDGQAELAGYQLTQPRYGETRQGTVVLITVTETMNPDEQVKSDRDQGVPVIKLNEVRDFQTGIYDYNAMTSVFLRLDGGLPMGHPEKVSTSVQEWCGHAYEELVVDHQQGGLRHTLLSYFEGESRVGGRAPAPEDGVMADALPMLVRGLTGELVPLGGERSVPWLGRALDRRLLHQELAWTRATIRRSTPADQTFGDETVAVETWTITPEAGPSSTWWVEAAHPRRLMGWTQSDGESARLTGLTRRPYWRDQGEGDEALLTELGLAPRPATPGAP